MIGAFNQSYASVRQIGLKIKKIGKKLYSLLQLFLVCNSTYLCLKKQVLKTLNPLLQYLAVFSELNHFTTFMF